MLAESRARTLAEIDEHIHALSKQTGNVNGLMRQWQIDRLVAEREWLRSHALEAGGHGPAA